VAHAPRRDLRDVARAREFTRQLLETALPLDEGVTKASATKIEDIAISTAATAAPLRLRVYAPVSAEESSLPCLYWMHGGGHFLGGVEQDDALLSHIVASVGCIAVGVDYRLAPEHPYPALMDDCYAGLAWLADNARRVGVDASRIAVGGASSGGGAAAGLALLARDRGEVPVCFQLLIYPMLDDRNVTPSSMAITDSRVWNREANLMAWHLYLGDLAGSDDVPPYAAPSRAADLAGLPPTFIGTGALDLFLDENIEYAQRLLLAQTATELHVYAGAHHAFDQWVPGAEVTRRLVRDRDDALRRAFVKLAPRVSPRAAQQIALAAVPERMPQQWQLRIKKIRYARAQSETR
jgi:acetyl esterase/lipase